MIDAIPQVLGAAEIARLWKFLSIHVNVSRVGGVEAVGGEDVLEVLGEAGRHDGAGHMY